MNWDWLQWCGCELSVYADLSKQILIESSAAGCVERFLCDDVSSWIVVAWCNTDDYSTMCWCKCFCVG